MPPLMPHAPTATTTLGSGIDLTDGQRSPQDFLYGCARFLSKALYIRFCIHRLAIDLTQSAVCAVGIEFVFCRNDQVAPVRSRQFKFLSDAHRRIGRRFRA